MILCNAIYVDWYKFIDVSEEFIFLMGVRLNLPATAATVWPTVPAPDDR
jgi:hypothetical protein